MSKRQKLNPKQASFVYTKFGLENVTTLDEFKHTVCEDVSMFADVNLICIVDICDFDRGDWVLVGKDDVGTIEKAFRMLYHPQIIADVVSDPNDIAHHNRLPTPEQNSKLYAHQVIRLLREVVDDDDVPSCTRDSVGIIVKRHEAQENRCKCEDCQEDEAEEECDDDEDDEDEDDEDDEEEDDEDDEDDEDEEEEEKQEQKAN